MSLYRTSKGFGVDWRDEFGRRHRKFIGSEEAARRMNAELQASGAMAHQALHHYRASEALSLSDGIDLYIAGLPVAPVTKRYQAERLKHAAERMGNPRLTDVTPQLLDAHTQVRRAELAPSSLAKEHQLLKQLFNFLLSK